MASSASYIGTTLKAALAVGGLALVLAVPASANMRANTTGGTSCKASAGPGADVFYFSNQTALNTSVDAQYITCAIPIVQIAGSSTPHDVQIIFSNTTATPGNITCALQSGYEVGTTVSGVDTAIYNLALPANNLVVLVATAASTPAIPPSGSQYDPYTLTCLIPAGAKIGVMSVLLRNSLTVDP